MIALLDEKLGDKALDLGDLKIELKGLGSEVSTALAELPDIDRQVWMQKSSAAHALMPVSGELAKYFDVKEGIVVRKVAQSSELKAGDVLLQIAGTSITELDQAADLLDDLDSAAEVQVQRHGRKREVTVLPGDFAGAGEKVVKKVIRIGSLDDEINVEVVDD